MHFQSQREAREGLGTLSVEAGKPSEEKHLHSGPVVMAWDNSEHTGRAVEWIAKHLASTGVYVHMLT